MAKKTAGPRPALASNPCAFLGALVAMVPLSDDREPLARVGAVVADTARAGLGRSDVPRPAASAVASVTYGLGPLADGCAAQRDAAP